MAKKSDVHFYKNKRQNSLVVRRRRKLMITGVLILIIFVTTILGLSWFLSQPFIVINNLVVSGNLLIATDDILAVTKKIITDSYFGLFAKSNIFFYPSKTIKKTLAATFPAIKNIHGNLENWQTLKLSVEERTPFGLWCQSVDTTACFYLDDNGLIFSAAAVFSDNIFLKFTGGEINASSSPLGKNFLPSDEFRRVSFFLDSLVPFGLIPIVFEANPNEYRIYSKNGGWLIINTADDLSQVLENLENIFRSDNFKKALARSGVIDYIDLRYGNKFFYKFKN